MLKSALIVNVTTEILRETLTAVTAVDLKLSSNSNVAYRLPIGVSVEELRNLLIVLDLGDIELTVIRNLLKIVCIESASAVLFKE